MTAREPITSAAAAKRIEPGTKLRLVRNLRGAVEHGLREVQKPKSKELVFKVLEGPHTGEYSYAPLNNLAFAPTEAGFKVFNAGGGLVAEYEWVNES